MEQKFNFTQMHNDRMVYVRNVSQADLPEDIRAEIGELDQVYAIHSEDGERLALVKNRELAFAVARTNDFVPVSVH